MPRRPPEIRWPINPVFEPPPDEPSPDNPMLARASVTFHTNDDDKDHDTAVGVYVVLRDELIAYISDEFGHFPDHSDSGPYTLLLVRRLPRHAIRQAKVVVGMDQVVLSGGRGDTWRFNFVLDFLFEDGSHQLCKAGRLELSTWNREHEFAVEQRQEVEVPDSALLTRASISFQTNDEDKDDDTVVDVTVALMDGTVVAQVSDFFGTFHDNNEDGPYDLELVDPRTRGEMKGGNVTLKISPFGNDTWRFNFFLDLLFDDDAHLIAWATGLELSDSQREQSFGVE